MSQVLTVLVDAHILGIEECAISKLVQINEKKKTSLPNKDYISDHRCERTNIASKC